MKLSELTEGKLARIVGVLGGKNLRIRLMELGFIIGGIIKIYNVSPMGKSYLLDCQGVLIALRYNIVNLIEVEEIKVDKILVI